MFNEFNMSTTFCRELHSICIPDISCIAACNHASQPGPCAPQAKHLRTLDHYQGFGLNALDKSLGLCGAVMIDPKAVMHAWSDEFSRQSKLGRALSAGLC